MIEITRAAAQIINWISACREQELEKEDELGEMKKEEEKFPEEGRLIS